METERQKKRERETCVLCRVAYAYAYAYACVYVRLFTYLGFVTCNYSLDTRHTHIHTPTHIDKNTVKNRYRANRILHGPSSAHCFRPLSNRWPPPSISACPTCRRPAKIQPWYEDRRLSGENMFPPTPRGHALECSLRVQGVPTSMSCLI